MSKSGRPRRNADEVLGQLTIRLSSKLKFGLELLARLQGRSLSQSVEWALQYALSNVHAGNSSTLASLADRLSKFDGWERAFWLHAANPVLVKFEERHACRIIANSDEWRFLDHAFQERGAEECIELYDCWRLVVTDIWPSLLKDSDELAIAPNDADGHLSLTAFFYGEFAPDIADRLRSAAASAREKGVVAPTTIPSNGTAHARAEMIRILHDTGTK